MLQWVVVGMFLLLFSRVFLVVDDANLSDELLTGRWARVSFVLDDALNGLGILLVTGGLAYAVFELMCAQRLSVVEQEELAGEIRQRKRAEEELIERERFLADIQKATQDAIRVIGRDGTVTWAERAGGGGVRQSPGGAL